METIKNYFDLDIVDKQASLFVKTKRGLQPMSPRAAAAVARTHQRVRVTLTGSGSSSYRSFLQETAEYSGLSRLYVAAAAANGQGKPRYCRGGDHAATSGLLYFLARNPVPGRRSPPPLLATGLQRHPAARAVRFLQAQGGSLPHLIKTLLTLGDIRAALLAATTSPRGISGREIVGLHGILGNMLRNGDGSSARTARQYADYMAGKETTTGAFEAVLGDRYRDPQFIDDSFAGKVISTCLPASDPKMAAGAAVLVGLGLIVSEWLAVELHPDFFDTTVLRVGDPNGYFMREYARWR